MSFTFRWTKLGWSAVSVPSVAVTAGVAAVVAMASLHAQQARKVDDATLLKPADGEWVSYGRDYAETHHSPLNQIDQSNVSRLGLAWSAEVGSEGKLETTPQIGRASCRERV